MKKTASARARSMKMTRWACAPGRPVLSAAAADTNRSVSLLQRRVIRRFEVDRVDLHLADARRGGHFCPFLIRAERIPALLGSLAARERDHVGHRVLRLRRIHRLAVPDIGHAVSRK